MAFNKEIDQRRENYNQISNQLKTRSINQSKEFDGITVDVILNYLDLMYI